MALYMYQVAYTAEAVAALIKEPQDRVEAVRPVLEAEGGQSPGGGGRCTGGCAPAYEQSSRHQHDGQGNRDQPRGQHVRFR
jgi:hypothetical protein